MRCTASSKAVLWMLAAACVVAVPLVTAAQSRTVASPFTIDMTDPGCQAATLVSTGGRMPANPGTLALRWTGYANYELVYKGQIVLLDAAFDRGSLFPPLGFKVADVTRANAILIGHGHADHMSDAAAVAVRTRAVVVGAPLTTAKLLTQSLAQAQIRTVSGRGEESDIVKLPGITIEPVLGRHSVRDTSITAPFEKVLQSLTAPVTPAQRAEQEAIGRRGVNDPRLTAEGTITYLITLDNGFRILYRDSAGDVTDFERAAIQRVGRIDLAIVALANAYLNTVAAEKAMEYVRAFKPAVFMPAHHDAPYNDLWRTTEPIFQVMKDENPNLVTISKGYREPVCFKTSGSAGPAR